MPLFVASDAREFAGFLGHWRDVKTPGWPVRWARVGQWKGRRTIALANGVGEAQVMEAILVAHACDDFEAVCSTGFCGALDPALSIGDIVIGNSVNGIAAAIPETARPYYQGSVITSDHVVATAEEKKRLRQDGALGVEMEAAGAAKVAGKLEVPFYCVKAVSDLAEESFANDFQAAMRPNGVFDLPRLAASALLRPASRIPELLRLQRRASVVGKVLGDFLDSCSF